jgi:hypothetical protein
LGELPLLLAVDLSLFTVEDGIWGYKGERKGGGFEILEYYGVEEKGV